MDESFSTLARVIVVCAHPDDESFGLGAILSTLAHRGSDVSVVCFTRGDLHTLRAEELAAACRILRVRRRDRPSTSGGCADSAMIRG